MNQDHRIDEKLIGGGRPRESERLPGSTADLGTSRRVAAKSDLPRFPRATSTRTATRVREAAVISLLANAGLRPGEALALRWDCVGDRVLIVEHGRDGSLKSTKTDRIRTVSLLAAVIEELDAWRTVASDPGR